MAEEFTAVDEERADEVTACYGEQKFSPVQYHMFNVGPFFYKTQVRRGETPAEALDRAYRVCVEAARKAYPIARDEFLERVKDSQHAARRRGGEG